MFVGHFAIAFLLAVLYPQVPLLVPLFAVGFPDLLWAILIFAGVEKLQVIPNNPLQKYLIFTKYPYSHSLVLTNIISLIAGVILSLVLHNFYVIPVFVLGCASHWILDTIVHLKDLPILGFDGDSKVGLGLWKYGKLAFVFEYVFYAAFVLALFPLSIIPGALFLGIVFHIFNINSFFGFTKKNPFDSSPRAYAAVTLIGFVLIPLFAGRVI